MINIALFKLILICFGIFTAALMIGFLIGKKISNHKKNIIHDELDHLLDQVTNHIFKIRKLL